MQSENVTQVLSTVLQHTLEVETWSWLRDKLDSIIRESSAKEMYMTYSLLASKIQNNEVPEISGNGEVADYLRLQRADLQQISRIYLLMEVLEADPDMFRPKVANIIQVADTGELATFLKFLVFLPNPEVYKHTAVEALRTNISTVFNAIALNNPYPALYFNEQQWNQMYLKTAFMQGDLSAIKEIDARANTELTRIISDYAHERWAASRDIDPYFWRPVAQYLNPTLLKDMQRLLKSDNPMENRVGALCCHTSKNAGAKELLEAYPELKSGIDRGEISWENLKDQDRS
ncbi:MAG: EboA domain-containing protein [Bacteroidota bacterium]